MPKYNCVAMLNNCAAANLCMIIWRVAVRTGLGKNGLATILYVCDVFCVDSFGCFDCESGCANWLRRRVSVIIIG